MRFFLLQPEQKPARVTDSDFLSLESGVVSYEKVWSFTSEIINKKSNIVDHKKTV